jgi:SAM-dependent methyltransferase
VTDQEFIKAAERGVPSYIWRAGQERRFRLIKDAAGDRIRGSVLDIGCGVGAYLEQLGNLSTLTHGVEYDPAHALSAKEKGLSLTRAAGEKLPFPPGTFDLILSHEVLEHVEDDRASLEEIVRVLKTPESGASDSGGRLILFVPNRGYPFETHGIFIKGKYYFGNIPLINYLPRRIRDNLVPHVRVYSRWDLERIFENLPVQILERRVIFGAYDNIIAKWPRAGRGIRKVLQKLEHTPLRVFGLSHFWVIERTY